MDTLRVDELAHPWGFDELVREGVALIPAYAPEWTNHNASDPGITLVELFAYFSEILAYRALRITPDAKLNFLRLLEGPDWEGASALQGEPSVRVDEAIRASVRALSHARCVVTLRDFELAALAAAATSGLLGAGEAVRARAIPGVDPSRAAMGGPAGGGVGATGDVSVILAPERELAADVLEQLCRQVQEQLQRHCLLTTRPHVIGPVYLHVFVGGRLALDEGVALADASAAIDAALRARFGPALADEPPAEARPFGRSLFLSEVAEVIDRADGVDWVDEISVYRMSEHAGDAVGALVGLRIGIVSTIAADTRFGGVVSQATRRLVRDADGEVVSVLLHPWELVRVRVAPDALILISDESDQRGAGAGGGRQGGAT